MCALFKALVQPTSAIGESIGEQITGKCTNKTQHVPMHFTLSQILGHIWAILNPPAALRA